MSIQRKPEIEIPILRAESVAAWREGEQFLERAKRDAAVTMQQAAIDAQQVQDQARQQGYDDGRQAGLEDAARLALEITRARDDYLQCLTPQLIQVVDAAVRKILGSLDDIDLIERVAANAMQGLREPLKVTLRVPPGFADALRERGALADKYKICLVEDGILQGSMCFMETPLGTIELSAQTQWERIFRTVSPAEGTEL